MTTPTGELAAAPVCDHYWAWVSPAGTAESPMTTDTPTPETPAGGLSEGERDVMRAKHAQQGMDSVILYVERILTTRVQARAEDRARIEAVRCEVLRLAGSIHGDSGWEHNSGCEGEPDCFACIEADLRRIAALTATEDGDRP